MRKMVLCFFLFSSNSVIADTTQTDTIQKWTDASGRVHYGDLPPVVDVSSRQQIEIHSTFDQQSYKQAIKRNAALYKDIKKIEKAEKSRAREAEKRLDAYLKYLDKKQQDSEREKARKKRYRESERNRTSIKLKRGKASESSSTQHPRFGL